MEGIPLLLSMVCINSTYCPGEVVTPAVNLDMKLSILGKTANPVMEKLEEEIKGKTLRIATLEDYPLSYVDKVNNELVGRGQAFQFLDMLMQRFKFNYTLVKPSSNIIGGSNSTDGSLIELLMHDKADMGVAFVPRIADLVRYVDFSTTLDEGDWKFIMRRPQESASGAGLLAPFHETVWFFILGSLFVTGPAIWGIIWLYKKVVKWDVEEPYYDLVQCCWYVYGGLMKQGSVLSPRSNSIRVAFATWWIYITIVTSFYTANLTAFLTLAKFSLPINEPQDLLRLRHRFICQKGFGFDYSITNRDEELGYLKPMLEKKQVMLVTQNNDTDILLSDVWEDDWIFVRDYPALAHLVYDDYRKRKYEKTERRQCPFATTKRAALRRLRGFIYQKGSKWKKLFDPFLQSLFEGGIVKHLLDYGLPRAEICPQNLGSSERQLRLHDLGTTYYTTIVGLACGLTVFFAELFTRYVNRKKRRERDERGGFGRNTTVRQVKEKPSVYNRNATMSKPSKMISPPPAYGDAIKTIFNTSNADDKGKVEGFRTFNGRTYAIVKDEGGTQMVPAGRTPSAALFNYQMNYNN